MPINNELDLDFNLVIMYFSKYYYKKVITFLRKAYPKRFLSNPKASMIVLDWHTYLNLRGCVKLEILRYYTMEVNK